MVENRSYDVDFEDYLLFIKKNIPDSLYINDEKNKDLFISVDSAFKLSDILTDFEFVENNANCYNLIVEYKKYFARILSAICLNDEFLINNILRLLTEKLYRIITGLLHPSRGERRIRIDSRSAMSNDIETLVDPVRKSQLDSLYGNLSQAIHHTKSSDSDMYDIRKLFYSPSNIVEQTLVVTENLTEIFLEEVFLRICQSKPELFGTSFNKKIENNLTPDVSNRIHSVLSL